MPNHLAMYVCTDCGDCSNAPGPCQYCGGARVWCSMDEDVIDGEDHPYAWNLPLDEVDDADDSE